MIWASISNENEVYSGHYGKASEFPLRNSINLICNEAARYLIDHARKREEAL